MTPSTCQCRQTYFCDYGGKLNILPQLSAGTKSFNSNSIDLKLSLGESSDYKCYITRCGQNIAVITKPSKCQEDIKGSFKVFSRAKLNPDANLVQPRQEFYIDLFPRYLLVPRCESFAIMAGHSSEGLVLILYGMNLCAKSIVFQKNYSIQMKRSSDFISSACLCNDNVAIFTVQGYLEIYNLLDMELIMTKYSNLQTELQDFSGEVTASHHSDPSTILFITNDLVLYQYSIKEDQFLKQIVFRKGVGPYFERIFFCSFPFLVEGKNQYIVCSAYFKTIYLISRSESGNLEVFSELSLKDLAKDIEISHALDFVYNEYSGQCCVLLRDKTCHFAIRLRYVLCFNPFLSKDAPYVFDCGDLPLSYQRTGLLMINNIVNEELLFLDCQSGQCIGFQVPLVHISLKDIVKRTIKKSFGREEIKQFQIPKTVKSFLLL